MKKILFIILLLSVADQSNAQLVVQGILKRTDSTVVKLDSVFVRPDTGSAFQPTFDITDTTGFYAVQLPTLPNGYRIVVSAKDCNGNFVSNTLTYNGGNTITSNLVVCVAPTFKITGYVHLGNASSRPPKGEGRVYLIEKCPGDVLSYIDSTDTDTNGFYSFDPYPTIGSACDLVMHAKLLPNSTNYSRYLPGYHINNSSYGLRWSDGMAVTKSMGNNGVNLLLPEAINPTGGPSEIAGYAVNAANNVPLQGYIMFLTDMNDVTVAYTHTDAAGKFSFPNLPFGTYKVFGDVWGKSNPDLIIRVHAEEVIVSDILFVENQTEYKGWRSTGINDVHGVKEILVFPNPMHDKLVVQHIPKSESGVQIRLLSIDGRTLRLVEHLNQSEYVMETSSLSSGVYILEVKQGSMVKQIKVLK